MIYVAWIMATRVPENEDATVADRARDAYRGAPIIWLLIIGGCLVIALLVFFAQT